MAYAQGHWPFNAELHHNDTLGWWQTLEEHEHSHVLAMPAINIYYIFPNSMADKRTASTMTWFNLAVRNH